VIEKTLGARIAALRKARGLTQEQLAERTGYSTEFISLVERGVNAPAVGKLPILAAELGCQVKDLFDFAKET
jgi:transcriptional regulator with XRE-family HTH domain